MLGRTLNRFRIESTIGRGGMGVVYKARDSSLDRYVAVKVLAADAVADPDRKRRFALEAKAASALNHPGIVTVHDVSADGDTDFIVMEWVDGRTLDDVIGSKGVGVATMLRYGSRHGRRAGDGTCGGHRPSRPQAVQRHGDAGRPRQGPRLRPGQAGRAVALGRSRRDAGRRPHRGGHRARDGGLHGAGTGARRGWSTPAATSSASAPCSIRWSPAGRRSPPTRASATLAKILDEDPAPPSRVVPVAAEIERAIMRCLRKDPARRYQTMADLKVALDDFVADSDAGTLAAARPAGAPAPARRGCGPRSAVPVLAAAAVAASSGGAVRRRRRRTALRAVPLASLPGVTRSPSFSPDGNQIAFTLERRGRRQPGHLRAADRRRRAPPADHQSGQRLQPAVVARWPLDRVPARRRRRRPARTAAGAAAVGSGTTRSPRSAREDSAARSTLAWCPDASCVVVTDSSGDGKPDALFVVSLDTGEKRQLSTPAETVFADTDPAISPDGKWLAFRRDLAPFSGELHLAALHPDVTVAGETRRLVPARSIRRRHDGCPTARRSSSAPRPRCGGWPSTAPPRPNGCRSSVKTA